jgi:hypothetical protein
VLVQLAQPGGDQSLLAGLGELALLEPSPAASGTTCAGLSAASQAGRSGGSVRDGGDGDPDAGGKLS